MAVTRWPRARGDRLAAALVGIGLLTLGCGAPEPQAPDAASTARALFALASGDEPTAEQIADLFGDVDSAERTRLLDALRRLPGPRTVRVADVEILEGFGETAVDCVADLGGGATAGYEIRLRPRHRGGYRIRWFAGPGVRWPEYTASGGSLSTQPAE
jgi:hypothetical protein